MTAGWQTAVYGAAMVLFALAFLADMTKRPGWPALVALGLALVTLVPLWAAASAA